MPTLFDCLTKLLRANRISKVEHSTYDQFFTNKAKEHQGTELERAIAAVGQHRGFLETERQSILQQSGIDVGGKKPAAPPDNEATKAWKARHEGYYTEAGTILKGDTGEALGMIAKGDQDAKTMLKMIADAGKSGVIPKETADEMTAAIHNRTISEGEIDLMERRVGGARADHRNLGKWIDQKSKDARDRWQRARAKIGELERELEVLKERAKAGTPPPVGPGEAPPRFGRKLTELEAIKRSPEYRKRLRENNDIIEIIQGEVGRIRQPELILKRDAKGWISGYDLAEGYKGGEWDWYRDFINYKGNADLKARKEELDDLLFSKSAELSLDAAAGDLRERLAGADLGQKIVEAFEQRQKLAEDMLREKEFAEATAKGKELVSASDLVVGDRMDVEGEVLRVKEVTEDGTAILEDGARFGKHIKLEDGQSIYVEKFEPKPRKPSSFVPEEEAPKGPLPEQLIPEGDMPFNLTSETPAEKAAREAKEAEAAKKDEEIKAAAAAAQAEKDQGKLDLEQAKPGTPPAPKPTTPFTFTPEEAARVEALKKALREKFKNTNVGVDPEFITLGAELTYNYVKGGLRTFRDVAAQILEDLGEKARKYLLSWYSNARMRLKDIAHELDNEAAAEEEYAKSFAPKAEPEPERKNPQRPGVRVARKELIPEPKAHIKADAYAETSGFTLDSEQVRGVNLALDQFDKFPNGSAFLLGDGPGFGKTAQELAVADQYRKMGLGKRILIVTQNKSIAELRFGGDAARMGIDMRDMTVTTFIGIGKLESKDWDLVIFDESHNLKNPDAKKSIAAGRLNATHKLFATATPMDKVTGAAYFLAEVTKDTEENVAAKLGYKLVEQIDRYTQEPYMTPQLLEGFSWAMVDQNIMAYRDAAIQAGAMIRREYPFFGTIGTHHIPMSMEGAAEQTRIIKHYDDLIKSSRNPFSRRNYAGQKTGTLSRWAEQHKLAPVVEKTLEDLKNGRQVVIVAETVNRQKFPIYIEGSSPEFDRAGKRVFVVDGAITRLKKMLNDAGVNDISMIHDPSANNIPKEVELFQGGKNRVALATPQSGGTGIDLDDHVGDKPRSAYILSRNFAGDAFEQLIGRFSRKNTASPAEVRFINLRESFADGRRNQILDRKLRTLRAIQGGEDVDQAGGGVEPPHAPPAGGTTAADIGSDIAGDYGDAGPQEAPKLDKRGRYEAYKRAYPESDAQMEPTGRVYSPTVRDLIRRKTAGEPITDAQIDAAVEKHMPWQREIKSPTPESIPSDDVIRNAVGAKAEGVGKAKRLLTEDEKVTLRQDIPSANNKGVGVVVVHNPRLGTAYEGMARIKNVQFKTNQRVSEEIAKGKAKEPAMVIQGHWSKDQSIPEDIDTWTRVGFNPDRHAFYYDKATGRPVESALEAVQVGSTVFAKEAKMADRSQFSYDEGKTQRERDLHQEAIDDHFNRAASGDEDAFDELDRIKRERLGDPPTGGAPGRDYRSRFQTADAFEAFMHQAYARGDFEGFQRAISETDRPIYVPVLKKMMAMGRAGDAQAEGKADWFRHVFAGRTPTNARPQTPPPPVTPPPGAPPPRGAPPRGAPPGPGAPPPGAPPPRGPGPAPAPPPPSGPQRAKFSMPGLIYIAKKMAASATINRRISARGRAIKGKGLELNAHLFKDPAQAAKTLAHEIGHWIDWIPASIKGSRLATKITPLRNFGRAFQTLFTHHTGKMSEVNKAIRGELVQLSKDWRGDFSPMDKYRNSSSELYADFLSVILNDPDYAINRAPHSTVAFFAALDEKPLAHTAYNLVNDQLRNDRLWGTLRDERNEASRKAMEDVFARQQELRSTSGGFKKAIITIFDKFVDRFATTAAKKGGFKASQMERMKNLGEDYTSKQEFNLTHFNRESSILQSKMMEQVYGPLRARGLDPQDLGDYLGFNRVLHDDTATSQWLRANPGDARDLFKWMIDEGGLDPKWETEMNSTPDHKLDPFGARLVRELHDQEMYEQVMRAAKRVAAPQFAEESLMAFDTSRYQLNPQGYTPKDAQVEIDRLKNRLGPIQFMAVEAAARNFARINSEIMRQAYDLGIISHKLWNERIAPNLGNYVPWMVLDYYTGFVSAGIKQKFGTAKLILRPDLAGALKTNAMLHRIAYQRAALELKGWMEHLKAGGFVAPEEMTIHKDLKGDKIRDIERSGRGVVGFWENGKYKHMELLDPSVADSITAFNPGDFHAALDTMRVNSTYWRLGFTGLNLVFWVANAKRTVTSAYGDLGWKNVKNLFLKDTWGIAWEYARVVSGSANMTPRVEELVRRNVLPAPHEALSAHLAPEQMADAVHEGLLFAAKAHGGTLESADLKVLAALENRSRLAYKAATTVWKGMAHTFAVMEMLPKISAEKTLRERGLPPKKVAALAMLEGIPNTGVSAKMNSMAEAFFLFFRVHVQGLRAMITKSVNPTTRAGFITRSLAMMGGATIGAQMAGLGVFDKIANKIFGVSDEDGQVDFEEMWRRATPYKLEHNFMLPMVWIDGDGHAHLPFGHSRIPQDWTPVFVNLGNTEDTRFIQPVVYDAYHSAIDLTPVGSGLSPVRPGQRIVQNIANLMVPGTNPTFGIVSDVWSTMSNSSPPTDSYTGRPKVSDDEWNAGSWNRAWAMLKYDANQVAQALPLVGAGFRSSMPNEHLPTWANVLRHTPGLNSMVVIDNYAGVREEIRARLDEKTVLARAHLMRGPMTIELQRRLSYLQTKGERRSPAETGEYRLLSKWDSRFYQGTAKKPGLFNTLKRAAAGDKTVDAKEARDIMESTAKDYLGLAGEIRKGQ